MRAWPSTIALTIALLGCAREGSDASPPPCAEGSCPTRFDACGEVEIAIAGGGCLAVGVPSSGCAEGFRSERGGCAPILPATPCAAHEMAIPGEASCRAIAPCPDGTFGAIPDDAGTIHVDQSATAVTPDGSRARPYTTLQAAIDALSSTRSTIAIAAGSYAENLIVRRPARIVGRCPALVEIKGASTTDPALTIGSNVVLESLAVTGSSIGIAAADTKGVVIDRVWVHDTAYIGIAALQRTRTTDVVVRDSLIEGAHESGVASTGALLTLERSVVRDTTSARPTVPAGFGVSALFSSTSKTAADVKILRSVVERSTLVSVSVIGSRLSLDGSIVRDTRTRSDGAGGGVALKATPGSGPPPEIHIAGSVLERSRDFGVELLDCAATIERSVIRDVVPEDTAAATGAGLGIRGGELTMLDSLVEDVRGAGLLIAAPARIEGTIVRRVSPFATAGTGELGVGLVISPASDTAPGPEVSLARVLVAETSTAGVLAFGAGLTVSASRIRDTRPTSNRLFGDGLVLIAVANDAGEAIPARAAVDSTEILRSARAGVATFASSVSLASSRVACASFDFAIVPTFVDSEGRTLASDAKLTDLAGNSCGCDSRAPCRASSASLQPISRPAAR